MRKRKRLVKFLPLTIISIVGLLYLFFFQSPDRSIQIPLTTFEFSFVLPFLFLVFLFLYSGISLVFKSSIHGLLVGLFSITYLIFRMQDLTHPFFLVMLLALFLTLEFFFNKT